jgi:hypothetical protein
MPVASASEIWFVNALFRTIRQIIQPKSSICVPSPACCRSIDPQYPPLLAWWLSTHRCWRDGEHSIILLREIDVMCDCQGSSFFNIQARVKFITIVQTLAYFSLGSSTMNLPWLCHDDPHSYLASHGPIRFNAEAWAAQLSHFTDGPAGSIGRLKPLLWE